MEDNNSAGALAIREAKNIALAAMRDGNLKDGRFLALKLLAALPSDPEALLLAAQSDILSGHPGPARALLDRAIALAPNLEVLHTQKQNLDRQDARVVDDPYVQQYLIARAIHMDYPMNIQLETVGRCNANCTFCPHEELDRKFEEMSDELFNKIIDEVGTIPNENPINFYMNVVNEPFMDKKIFERIRKINETVPQATLGFYTNLNVLPRNFFEKIRNCQRITYVNVSFNAANEEEYRETMRIDFDRTVSNIRRFLIENREQKFLNGPLYLSRIATFDDRDVRFQEDCRDLFADFEVGVDYVPNVKSRASWLGQVSGGQEHIPQLSPCFQWLNISVFCDGTVPHCCMDATGKFAFGNVKEKSLLEIYNSPEFRNMREAVMGRGAVYPCNTCALR